MNRFSSFSARLSIFLICLLMAVACQSNSVPSENISLDIRAGKVFIDPDAFDSASLRAMNSRQTLPKVAAELTKRNMGDLGRLLNLATSTQAINLWISVLENGRPPTSRPELKLSNISETYTEPLIYRVGAYWEDYVSLPVNIAESYSVEAKYKGITKTQTTKLAGQTIGIPQNLSVSATSSSLDAMWEPVQNAKAYVYLIYDPIEDKFVYANFTKEYLLGFSGGGLNLVEGKQYEFWLITTSWDAIASRYQPITAPEELSASVTVIPLYVGQKPLESSPEIVNITSSPNASVNGKLELSNPNNSPVAYWATSENNNHLTILTNAKGSIPAQGKAVLDYRFNCGSQEGEQLASLNLRATGRQSRVLFRALCYYPPQILSFTAIQTRINAGDSVELAWSVSGSRPFSVSVTSPSLSSAPIIGDTQTANRVTIWPSSTIELTLRLVNPFGEIIRALTVTVLPQKAEQLWLKESPGGSMGQFPFSVDGSRIVYTNSNGLTVLNSQTGVEVGSYRVGQVMEATWSPDVGSSQIAYYRHLDSRVHIINSTTGVGVTSLPVGSNIWGLHWTQSGILIGTLDNRLIIWNPITGSSRTISLPTDNSLYGAPIWSPDRSKIAYSSSRNIRVINSTTGVEEFSAEGSGVGLSWSPDGRYLATKYAVINLTNGTIVQADSETTGDYQAFLPDGKRILVGGDITPTIKSAFGERTRPLWKATHYGSRVAISPDGSLAIVAESMISSTNFHTYRLSFGQ